MREELEKTYEVTVSICEMVGFKSEKCISFGTCKEMNVQSFVMYLSADVH